MVGGTSTAGLDRLLLAFLGESTPRSKDNGEVRQMHSPSSVLPHFYAAIVKVGSLIKTKETHSIPKKKRNIPGILLCADFPFLD
jgi:hypothetical protein